MRRLAAPVICVLLLCLCLPYTVSKGVTPLLGMLLEMSVSFRDVWIFLYLSVHNKDHFLVVRGLISGVFMFLVKFSFCNWNRRWPNGKKKNYTPSSKILISTVLGDCKMVCGENLLHKCVQRKWFVMNKV